MTQIIPICEKFLNVFLNTMSSTELVKDDTNRKLSKNFLKKSDLKIKDMLVTSDIINFFCKII